MDPSHETAAFPLDAGPALDAAARYRTLFDATPTGLIVTSPAGDVVDANATSARMLGAGVRAGDARCCVLLGCREPGSPLAHGCLSELASRTDEPLPEIRVDLPGRSHDAELESAWVVASRVNHGEDLVLLQLRPGAPGDRRRRTEPHWITGPRLRVFVLGRTRVESGEGALTGEWLGHRPGELLKYLVVHRGRVVSIDELLEVFWPTARRASAGSVRQAIHVLRERVEPPNRGHGASAFILARKGGYELNLANVWVDVDAFEEQLRIGMHAHAAGDTAAAEAALMAAMKLHGGVFMSDEPYAEWTLSERDRLRDRASQALRTLARIRLDAGDEEAACHDLLQLAELQPFDLEIQKELLSVMMRRKRVSDAARRLDVVRQRWKRMLGEELQLELADLAATR